MTAARLAVEVAAALVQATAVGYDVAGASEVADTEVAGR